VLRCHIQTPTGAAGAIAAVALAGRDGVELEAGLAQLGIDSVGEGRVAVRDLLGVDRGIVARWSDRAAHVMPHGGLAVARALMAAIAQRGLEVSGSLPPRDEFPEAASLLEARMLAALAAAASPAAVDLLLAQPGLWPAWVHDLEKPPEAPGGEAPSILGRLIRPPLVVALGASNVGKSTLVNALAGRSVSLVADEPGTTRDHVGVMLDLGGLVVRFLDTPGLRPEGDAVEREAAALALRMAAGADLLLLAGDSQSPPPRLGLSVPALRVALRSDLGEAAWPHDQAVSAVTGENMDGLVRLIRCALVPPEAVEDLRPWRFWEAT
jgi:tRNA modification GTPase